MTDAPGTREQAGGAARTKSRPTKAAGAVAAVILVIVAMISGALLISSQLKSKASSCREMAAHASAAESDEQVRHVELIIGITGNSAAEAEEVRSFVATALDAKKPDSRTVATVRLVNGDREYVPEENVGECIGRAVLISAATADLGSYVTASAEARDDLASSLRKQYRGQRDRVANAAYEAVIGTPSPSSGDAGAFVIWPFVAQARGTHDVRVLGPFTVGGDNCLTVSNPGSPHDGGGTVIADRVARCVQASELTEAKVRSLRLSPAGGRDLSGAQRAAQTAVILALCSHANRYHCT